MENISFVPVNEIPGREKRGKYTRIINDFLKHVKKDNIKYALIESKMNVLTLAYGLRQAIKKFKNVNLKVMMRNHRVYLAYEKEDSEEETPYN